MSEYSCPAGAMFCAANMLVGSSWVSARMSFAVKNLSQSSADSSLQKVLKAAATALSSATIQPAWMPPGSPPDFCSRTTTSDIDAALGVGNLKADTPGATPFDNSIVSQSPAVFASCSWTGPDFGTDPSPQFNSLGIEELRGGAWAMPHFLASPPRLEMIGTYSPTTISGASSAMMTCGAGECDALVTVGPNLVDIGLNETTLPAVKTALAKLVALIAAS
jgi:hypothetical protein